MPTNFRVVEQSPPPVTRDRTYEVVDDDDVPRGCLRIQGPSWCFDIHEADVDNMTLIEGLHGLFGLVYCFTRAALSKDHREFLAENDYVVALDKEDDGDVWIVKPDVMRRSQNAAV